MRALRYHTTGPATALRLEEVPQPTTRPGEVLVRVHAASVNPVDWKIAAGSFKPLVRGGLPRTMGSDFAGEVVASGPGAEAYRPGDRVFGFIDPFTQPDGTFADYVAVEAPWVHRLPPQIGFADAAALACVGATAVAMCTFAQVRAGQRVLVNGAAGGVGHVAVQVAVARGASVTGTGSPARRDFIRGLGADSFIDYRSQPMEAWSGGYDAVLDCVPNIPRRLHARLLVAQGHYVTTIPGPATFLFDPLWNRIGRVRRHGVMLRPDSAAMEELLRYVAQGRLRCTIEQSFPLHDAVAAVEQSRAGHTRGKIVITAG